MSKVQGRDASLLTDLANTTIAGQLESRLRELERNIAVARQFIKLADESYSELRHKWNLWHEEVRNKPQAHATEQSTLTLEKTETRTRARERSKTRAKDVTELNEPKSPSSADVSAKPESHAKRAKTVDRSKKEPEISGGDPDSIGSEKHSQPYRDPGRRRGKISGHN